MVHCGSCSSQALQEVLVGDDGFLELGTVDLGPGHLSGLGVAGGAGREQVVDGDVGVGGRGAGDLLEVRGTLHGPHWLHHGVSHDHRDIRAWIVLHALPQLGEVLLIDLVGRASQVNLHHLGAGVQVGQANVDTFLKTPSNGRV